MTIPAIDAIYAAIGAGETSYLDCCEGVGRTGTVVGGPCSSGEHGNANALRYPSSPETAERVAFIERWPPG